MTLLLLLMMFVSVEFVLLGELERSGADCWRTETTADMSLLVDLATMALYDFGLEEGLLGSTCCGC